MKSLTTTLSWTRRTSLSRFFSIVLLDLVLLQGGYAQAPRCYDLQLGSFFNLSTTVANQSGDAISSSFECPSALDINNLGRLFGVAPWYQRSNLYDYGTRRQRYEEALTQVVLLAEYEPAQRRALHRVFIDSLPAPMGRSQVATVLNRWIDAGLNPNQPLSSLANAFDAGTDITGVIGDLIELANIYHENGSPREVHIFTNSPFAEYSDPTAWSQIRSRLEPIAAWAQEINRYGAWLNLSRESKAVIAATFWQVILADQCAKERMAAIRGALASETALWQDPAFSVAFTNVQAYLQESFELRLVQQLAQNVVQHLPELVSDTLTVLKLSVGEVAVNLINSALVAAGGQALSFAAASSIGAFCIVLGYEIDWALRAAEFYKHVELAVCSATLGVHLCPHCRGDPVLRGVSAYAYASSVRYLLRAWDNEPFLLAHGVIKPTENRGDWENTLNRMLAATDDEFAWLPPVTISGTVTDGLTHTGVQGITLRASTGETSITANSGRYTLTVQNGWSGTIAGIGTGTFTPQPLALSSVSTNLDGQDFVWHHSQIGLSNPRVLPASGNTGTYFEFSIDYYDPEGSVPHPDFHSVFVGGMQGTMSLKSGTAANGTYHYRTRLNAGNYRYEFFFATTDFRNLNLGPFSGPTVYSSSQVPINIVIQSKYVTPDLILNYSVSGGAWTTVALNQNPIPQIVVSPGATFSFSRSTTNPNFACTGWELWNDGTNAFNSANCDGTLTLGPGATSLDLVLKYDYVPQNYTVSGTARLGNGSLVPGGVDLLLTSPEQTNQVHTDSGTFSFSGVRGGVSVSVTPSATLYAFSPPALAVVNLRDNISKDFTAYLSDDQVPFTTVTGGPLPITTNQSVSFTWTGQDDSSSPANLQYTFQLEGYDTNWSSWNTATSVSFTLPNGAYTFRVCAKDEAGNINQDPATFSFAVNANPQVLSVTRIPVSVWATRILLQGGSGGGQTFVLLPAHAPASDPDLVPVTEHIKNTPSATGANSIISTQTGLPTTIIRTNGGWLVTLPQALPAGSTLELDIIWGRIVYFGWHGYVQVPRGFPSVEAGNGSGVDSAYLDDQFRLWRIAERVKDFGQPRDRAKWVLMDVAHLDAIVKPETQLRFCRGQVYLAGVQPGVQYDYSHLTAFPVGSSRCLLWNDWKSLYDGNTEAQSSRLGVTIFNQDLQRVQNYDTDYISDAYYSTPTSSMDNGAFWLQLYRSASTTYADELSFYLIDAQGNPLRTRVTFDTSGQLRSSYNYNPFEPLQVGENVLLYWDTAWRTSLGKDRRAVRYQIRNRAGDLVVGTASLMPLLPDNVSKNDRCFFFSGVADSAGNAWLSFRRYQTGVTTTNYFVVVSSSGSILMGPTPTASIREFRCADKDGYIWCTEGSTFMMLRPDASIAITRTNTVRVPNQRRGNLMASTDAGGYALFDRWGHETAELDVLPASQPLTLDIYDLDLWSSDLHPANLSLKTNQVLVWSNAGQFRGHSSVPATFLNAGENIVSFAQDDLLGGQILVTSPYRLTHIISASSGAHGSVFPHGQVSVDNGTNLTLTFTPEPGYRVATVLLDGQQMGALRTLTLTNITADHSVQASFENVNYAQFAGCDLTSSGNWRGVYGTGGWVVIGNSTNVPTGTSFSFAGGLYSLLSAQTPYAWALERADTLEITNRIAACWHSATGFSINVQVPSESPCEFALYCLDWDASQRVQQVEVVDPLTQTVIDTQVLRSFSHGVYLNWIIRGSLQVKITPLSGDAVCSALLFGTAHGASPSVRVQPSSQTTALGQQAVLGVGTSGSPPLQFQWSKDGTNIPGATGPSLVIESVQLLNAGVYTLLVTNAYGWTNTLSAVLTLYAPPIILMQPIPRTNRVGSSLSFSVTASNAAPLSYQWQKDGVALGGATERIYTIVGVQNAHQGVYRAVVSNIYGASVTSSNATLTVWPVSTLTDLAGPILNPANGHEYYLLSQGTWLEAEAAAVRLGGHLTTVRSQAEQDWIYSTFSHYDGISRGLCIGLYDPDPLHNATDPLERQAEFVWVSGEAVSYTNWPDGQPNNWREAGEFWVHMFWPGSCAPGYWNDVWDTDYNTAAPLNGVAEVVPLRFTSDRLLPSGAVELELTCGAGWTYLLQASTNLADWRSFLQATPTSNSLTVVDMEATNYAFRFYRALGYPYTNAVPHPADLDANFLISTNEFMAYSNAFKLALWWPIPPIPPNINYFAKANQLWKLGTNGYHVDLSLPPPNCLVPGR